MYMYTVTNIFYHLSIPYMYTVTNIFYHLSIPYMYTVTNIFSIPLQWHSAINRTVMPKLKYPFLMKSSFHNDVKMQALHVHVTTCKCYIFVCGCIILTTL